MAMLLRHFEELYQLKIVIEQGSINRAAPILGISQPALTRGIKRLEQHLGVRLLYRTAKGVFATAFGEALLTHTRLLGSELEKAAETIEMLKSGVRGQIRCGGTLGSLSWLIPTALGELLDSWPNLRIQVVEGMPAELMAMLRLGELDLAVCSVTSSNVEAELKSYSIASDSVLIFARSEHSFFKSAEQTLHDLVQTQNWIMPRASGQMSKAIRDEFERQRVDSPKRVIETSSYPTLVSLLRAKDRLAVTTSYTLAKELADGVIQPLSLEWQAPKARTLAYHRSDITPAPQISTLIKLLQKLARKRKPASNYK